MGPWLFRSHNALVEGFVGAVGEVRTDTQVLKLRFWAFETLHSQDFRARARAQSKTVLVLGFSMTITITISLSTSRISRQCPQKSQLQNAQAE